MFDNYFYFLKKLISVLTFNAGYNAKVVVLGATVLGLTAGVVGTFLVLRKRALVSDALAHSTLPGVAVAFLLLSYFGFDAKNTFFLLSGAAVSALFGSFCVSFISSKTRLAEDAAIGAVLSVFFGFGVVLLSIIQGLNIGSEGGIHNFIYGHTASLRAIDVKMIFLLGLFSIIAAALFIKEFSLVCFDPDFAKTDGWPVSLIDYYLMALVVLVTVLGLQTVGLLLVISLLIIPATIGRFWSNSLSKMTVVSALAGALSCYIGASVSSILPNYPAGAVIVLTSGFFFIFSLLFSPVKGVFASMFRRVSLGFRILLDHTLRDFYEEWEFSKTSTAIADFSLSKNKLKISFFQKFSLYFFRYVKKEKDKIYLTEKGVLKAQEAVRNHRIWEEYIAKFGSVDISHVDFSADLAEHVLSPQIVKELEGAIESSTKEIKESLHTLEKN